MEVARRVEIRRLAAEWAERTAVEQGLPATVEDEATLQEVATLLCAGRTGAEADQTRHAGLIRPVSNRLRPRTAGPI